MADRQTSYNLELGDRVNIGGQTFILTEVHLQLNRPPKLTAKHASELTEPPAPDFDPRVFGDREEGIG